MSHAFACDMTVLIPVFACADRLPGHLPSIQTLRESGATLLWVITASEDGSDRLARQAQKTLGGTILEVPRGLYEAWNLGLKVVTTPFTYISTVGESVSPRGLEQLRECLLSTQADVCFTPPQIPATGTPRNQLLQWPVFRERLALRKREGKILSPFFVAGAQVSAGIHSLLGSCASCLFRTAYLQSHPFPSGYFHYGDSAWVYENYRTARLVYRDIPLAAFWVHGPSGRAVGVRHVEKLRRMIWRDLQHDPRTTEARRALGRLCAAARALDHHRGRQPGRGWWLRPRLLQTRWIRMAAEKAFRRAMQNLEDSAPSTTR